jgi:predicted molibdopterin-dependent oxidoreductase YjgC
MPEVTFTIDGRIVKAESGMTVFGAAKKIGIHIPHLCYSEDLSPASACRLCVVEVEGARTLAASCTLPVSNNMVVKTNTARVIAARRMILEFLLSDHPYDCMTCEKSGSCELERYAYEFGIRKTRFEGEQHQYSIDLSNPFIVRDYNKCILCERCVKACDEISEIQAIDYAKRGFNTKVATPFDGGLKDSDCVFCGQCVQVCPTGALSEKKAQGMGRSWEFEKVRTTCPYCGVGCQLWLHVKDGRIKKVTAVEDGAPNKGRLCVKGRFGYDFIYSEDRLKTPLIREKNGEFRETSWEEALDLVAGKFKEIIAEHGPDAIAGVSCARSINEDSYQMQKLFRAVIGTNNIDHCART